MIFLEQPVVDGHALATDHFSAEVEKKTRHSHILPHIDAVHLYKKVFFGCPKMWRLSCVAVHLLAEHLTNR